MSFRFSIVINTYNRANLLEDALSGLSELDYDDFEIIVVNGPSSDHTKLILDRWSDRIKVSECNQANLSMSRNIGISIASGDIICFVDDDAVPHPAWLRRLAIHYYDDRVGAVGGFTIDNSGASYQVRKTVCDRYGNAFFPSDFFDERPLCFAGSPFFPSLLGTNSSFRATALREIGGFDHAFAYLLDETDVCLRIVDSGYSVRYEPDAMVFHQFAPSHIRGHKRIAKTLYPSAVSKAYFINRHGQLFDSRAAQVEMERYEQEILDANKWLFENREITQTHRSSLDDDLLFGIADGKRLAVVRNASQPANLVADLQQSDAPPEFLPMVRKSGLRIVFISKSFPPSNESGIARWTWMMAKGLSQRGHTVHVVTLAAQAPFTRYENGFWTHGIHEILSEEGARRASALDIPDGLAPWCMAVEQEVRRLGSFGVEVVSFPIWDLEGIALLGRQDIGLVMSLHTTYAMARPYKIEWNDRPLFGHLHVDRVIAAETRALREVPNILANSQAIVDDLTRVYEVDLAGRVVMAAHGTADPWASRTVAERELHLARERQALVVTFVGRFEARKGFDIAVQAFVRLLDSSRALELQFVGDNLSNETRALIDTLGGQRLLSDPRVRFRGQLSREALDRTYIDSDVVLMPSRYESFGLVAIEAFAADAPVVALAVGGLQEVVEDGITGFVVRLNDDVVENVVDRLKRLLDDEKLLLGMKKNARAAFESRYSIDSMVAAAEAVYLKAAKVKT